MTISWWWVYILVIMSTDILRWCWLCRTMVECLSELLIFIACPCPTADNLKSKCPAVSVAIVSNTLECVLLDASRKMFSPSYTVTHFISAESFINTFHWYFNIYHWCRILRGIPYVYLLYSWKFPSAGLRVQPKKGPLLSSPPCLPLKDWLSFPKNQSMNGEMCSGLLPHMLRRAVVKFLLFYES